MQFLFIEYKGQGNSSNANESRRIESALKAGVREPDLMFVLY